MVVSLVIVKVVLMDDLLVDLKAYQKVVEKGLLLAVEMDEMMVS